MHRNVPSISELWSDVPHMHLHFCTEICRTPATIVRYCQLAQTNHSWIYKINLSGYRHSSAAWPVWSIVLHVTLPHTIFNYDILFGYYAVCCVWSRLLLLCHFSTLAISVSGILNINNIVPIHTLPFASFPHGVTHTHVPRKPNCTVLHRPHGLLWYLVFRKILCINNELCCTTFSLTY